MENLLCYRQLPTWNYNSIPQGFKQAHNTKIGTWAKLKILRGQLRFVFLSEAGTVLSEHLFTVEQQAPFIEPQAWHQIISASEDLECQLSFYCQPHDYFSKKYQLASTHSEIIAALPYLHDGQALDIGSGTGRNSLFLSQNGFAVDAWDINEKSIATLQKIIQTENIKNISPQIHDLNQQLNIEKNYDFICCTVVMMFLQANAIPSLIHQMKNATQMQGFNLIVCAMQSQDYPAQTDFPFVFTTDELRTYYQDWKVIQYNENIGELHRVDEHGQRIKQRFATLLAQKV